MALHSAIRNSQFAIQNRNISPLPRATTCIVLPDATRRDARGMATRWAGARKSSPSGYGFTVFVLLTSHCQRIENPLQGNQAVTSLKVSGTFIVVYEDPLPNPVIRRPTQ